MRVKFNEKCGDVINNAVVMEIDKLCLLDGTNEIYLGALCADSYSYKSTKPLKAYDECYFIQWIDSLLINGYADLTGSEYVFVMEEDEEDDEGNCDDLDDTD